MAVTIETTVGFTVYWEVVGMEGYLYYAHGLGKSTLVDAFEEAVAKETVEALTKMIWCKRAWYQLNIAV